MRITSDMIAVSGLAIALVAGIALNAPAELLTAIAGGLSGYISKAAVQAAQDKKEDVK